MPHQWLEGNLPVSARCAVCDRTCGSVRRLQDWRCLWCKAIVRICPPPSPACAPGEAEAGGIGAVSPGSCLSSHECPRAPQVHSACKELFGKRCPLGQYKVSIIPPTALNSIDSDGESGRGRGSVSSVSAGSAWWHCARCLPARWG